MKSAKQLELNVLIKEHEKQKLQLKIEQAKDYCFDIIQKGKKVTYEELRQIIYILDGVYHE